ncbi:hypothetical protein ABZ622_39350 [Streptomyces sp. NPDC007164]|uniref:hypothetical protein n=1 Tax=Streptomyces sp. NPDC007164 TaxID=3156918 RepID=UPI0033C63B98
MSAYTATYFLGTKAHFRGNVSVHPALYVEPDGKHRPGYVTFQLDSEISIDEQLKVADRFAKAVSAWRDELATRADQQRTAADELEAAQAEIARLKAEAGDES